MFAQNPYPPTAAPSDAAEIRELREQLQTIAARLSLLEARAAAASPSVEAAPAVAPAATAQPAAAPEPTSPHPVEPPPADKPVEKFFHQTTINFAIDGYYGYNFNSPADRVNQLRAYDVTSNSFSLNQASLIVERLPTSSERLGGRVDLQFGQATETLQGSSINEQRPQVWRNLFQAYGSYLAPIGSGLQIDFGKWASALGSEGNYTKDQVAYSRAFSFDYLPFYHMGLRANYNVTPRLNIAYWLVNGANDTEDLNSAKSQAVLFTLKPAKTLTWAVNYYFGSETRDQPASTGSAPAPAGREHIFDSYATWNPIPRLTLTGEGDFVLNRSLREQRPPRVAIASLTARYALPHDVDAGLRAEYLDDRGGLFSSQTQALKEVTVVADHIFAPGFLARAEYRRDFSNRRFFSTDTSGVLVKAQTTATLGLIYWWGTKQGSW